MKFKPEHLEAARLTPVWNPHLEAYVVQDLLLRVDDDDVVWTCPVVGPDEWKQVGA